VYCLDAQSGKTIWTKNIERPQRVFPPVVYNQKVYVPSNGTLYCLDYKTGSEVWAKDYGRFITSNPSFTDRAIIFSLDNSMMAIVNPNDGSIMKSIETGEHSSPYYVTVNDILYLAYNEKKSINNKEITSGIVRAVNFSDNTTQWEFHAPFPGPVSQPTASNGILYLPAGNYVYAIGTEYYTKIIQGGEGYAVVDNKEKDKKKIDEKLAQLDHDKKKDENPEKQFGNDQRIAENTKPEDRKAEERKPALRELTVTVGDDEGKALSAQVEIRKWENGRLVYNETKTVKDKTPIMVPEGDGVELTASANGYLPKKEILTGKEKDSSIRLDRIEKGKTFVVDNINFEFNKAYLKKESMNLVERVLRIMKENPGLKVEVSGHTDNIGDAAYNQKLSERRADAVAEYMIKNGISPERITSKGFGETKPIVPNTNEKNRAKNRRTEFKFVD
ncbi:MAG TPA: OmpA family protein, partial [Spirochaetota bacterium]